MPISERVRSLPAAGSILPLLSNPRIAGAAALGYTVVITNLLLAPHPLWLLGEQGDWVAKTVARTLSDDLEHASAYAVFLSVWLWASQTGRWITPRTCLGLTLGHALIAEVLQYWIPQRFFDVHDLVANGAGCLLAGLTLRWLGMFQVSGTSATASPSRFESVGPSRPAGSVGVLPD